MSADNPSVLRRLPSGGPGAGVAPALASAASVVVGSPTAMPVGAQGADERLVKSGFVSREQYDIAVRKKSALADMGQDTHLYDVLVRDRFLSRERSNQLRGQTVVADLQGSRSLLPLALCERLLVVPAAIEEGDLRVMAARPLSPREKQSLVDACILRVTGLRITPIDRTTMHRELRRLSTQVAAVAGVLQEMRNSDVTASGLSEAVQGMLIEALRARASDIHLDVLPDPDSWISYRIDGQLQQRHQVPQRVMQAIFTRLKTETGMDASDSRRAQDGRLGIEFSGRHIDFRAASQPLAQGETIALRVLDPDSLPGIDSLFPASPDMTERVRAVATVHGKTGGLLLFSGPTGSGKTTTLYAVSQSFPRDRINVVTVEDPVEYTLPFARQIQINQLLEERTSGVERSILRQDPDVIVFGEIRDADSARAALKFTESGHLVLATIHATSALQTFERFISFFDESVKREALFIMAHSLRLLFSQRLAQRLCVCARPAGPEDAASIAATLAGTGIELPEDATVRMRSGCVRCNHTGIFGRVLGYEALFISADETARMELIAALEKSGGNYSLITQLAGAYFKPRVTALVELIAAGQIDPLGARRVLGM